MERRLPVVITAGEEVVTEEVVTAGVGVVTAGEEVGVVLYPNLWGGKHQVENSDPSMPFPQSNSPSFWDVTSFPVAKINMPTV